jgi:hypothetical protein
MRTAFSSRKPDEIACGCQTLGHQLYGDLLVRPLATTSEARTSVLPQFLFFRNHLLTQCAARRRDRQGWFNIYWVQYRNKNFPSRGFSQIGGPKPPKMSKISSISTTDCCRPQKREPARENKNIFVHLG